MDTKVNQAEAICRESDYQLAILAMSRIQELGHRMLDKDQRIKRLEAEIARLNSIQSATQRERENEDLKRRTDADAM